MTTKRTKDTTRKRTKSSELKRKFLAFIFHNGVEPYGGFTRFFYEKFERLLDEIDPKDADSTEIDLVLVSFGGDAHITYKVLLELRARCRWLRVIVPDFAKSAATLIALGSDEIYMGPAAELGPFDEQWEHPNREDRTLSALDIANAPKFLAQLAAQRVTRPSVAHFLQPLADKVDPLTVLQVRRQLECGVDYLSAAHCWPRL